MWTYFLLIILPVFIQHTRVGIKTKGIYYRKKKQEMCMLLFWILLVILLILRDKSVGVDLDTYEYIFEYLSRSNWLTAITRSSEIGWNMLNKIVAIITNGSFRCLIVISAFLSTYWISKSYVKYSVDASLSISLFIILTNFILLFSGLKQSIAISLGFLAFEFTRNKKLIPFILVTITAMLFHTSAFMIFFMYPLYHLRVTKKWLFFVIPLLIVVWIFNAQIFTVLGLVLSRFTDYDTSINGTGSITMLILFIIFAIFSYLIPKESKLDSDTIAMRNYLLLSIALQMFAPLHLLAMRMNYYYIAFIPLLIPRVIYYRSNKWSEIGLLARNIMLVFFILYFFFTSPSDNVLETFPYTFFWESL